MFDTINKNSLEGQFEDCYNAIWVFMALIL